MTGVVPLASAPCGLAEALENRGFTGLTAIQEAVLDPAIAGRDLRLSSKTGSGKTVAIGFVVAQKLGKAASGTGRGARPTALLVAPTRELAAQIARELEWLFKSLAPGFAVLTGGTPIGGDFRALKANPAVVVGTPGRLVDHLRRGSLSLDATSVVVLDEADEMLDMGFRDELEELLQGTPEDRETHLVSATFPHAVLALAKRYQKDPVMVHGSPQGAPNQDIQHTGHLVDARHRSSALVNILLAASPTERILVFARTRVATAELSTELCKLGFKSAALNGDMGQSQRNTTLEAFRAGAATILVATDVAARGLDIDDIGRVVHFDVPENGEVYTHRSGRTGRAGKKGTSIILTTPRGRGRVEHMVGRVGVKIDWQPVKTPKQVKKAADKRLRRELAATTEIAETDRTLAEKLLVDRDPVELVAALLARGNHRGPTPARVVAEPRAVKSRPVRESSGRNRRDHGGGTFKPFHITWGAKTGANPSRVLAMVCRRGEVRSQHIGAIRVTPFSSVVEVQVDVAENFARAAQKPDTRNPKVRIRPWNEERSHKERAPHNSRKAHRPSRRS